jgi:hypothetical protein
MITSQWTTAGTNIFYYTSNAGFGSSKPEQSLNVTGNKKANNLYIYNPLSDTRSISFTQKPTTLSAFFEKEGHPP